jgi:hypothetical protein
MGVGWTQVPVGRLGLPMSVQVGFPGGLGTLPGLHPSYPSLPLLTTPSLLVPWDSFTPEQGA